MKTPDKIKKGLELHTDFDESCVGKGCPFAGGEAGEYCVDILARDALAYIRQLEQQNAEQAVRFVEINKTLEQVTRERDALLDDLSNSADACVFCKKINAACRAFEPCGECEFEWRGVPEDAEHE